MEAPINEIDTVDPHDSKLWEKHKIIRSNDAPQKLDAKTQNAKC